MSPIKLLNILLLLAVVIGGVLTYLANRTYQPLLAEKTRLEQKVGSLTIEDPSKIHVQAFETGEPMHFAWRVYVPAGADWKWQYSSGRSTSSSRGGSHEFVVEMRFREGDHGGLMVFIKQYGGGGTSEVASPELTDLLRSRWDEIQVEQLGREHLVVVEPDEIASLLRLTLSEPLKQEAKQKLPKHQWKYFQPSLFDHQIGFQEAFRKAQAAQSSADP